MRGKNNRKRLIFSDCKFWYAVIIEIKEIEPILNTRGVDERLFPKPFSCVMNVLPWDLIFHFQ